MRDWKVNPKLLCRQHLLGSHFELHKALGNLNHSGIWTRALTKKGYLEPQNLRKRHEELVQEMISRGYKHDSPLEPNGTELPVGRVDVQKSIRDLRARCPDCRKKILRMSKENSIKKSKRKR